MFNPPDPLLFHFIADHDVIWYGISLLLVWATCPVMPPPRLLCSPWTIHWRGGGGGGQSEKQRRTWYCAKTVWQKLKHYCAIGTVLVQNLKHYTIWAAIKKINCILARTSTIIKLSTSLLKCLYSGFKTTIYDNNFETNDKATQYMNASRNYFNIRLSLFVMFDNMQTDSQSININRSI